MELTNTEAVTRGTVDPVTRYTASRLGAFGLHNTNTEHLHIRTQHQKKGLSQRIQGYIIIIWTLTAVFFGVITHVRRKNVITSLKKNINNHRWNN